MTNRSFFVLSCTKEDLCAIWRYLMWDLGTRFSGRSVPEKEEILEKWLDQPFDSQQWESARRQSQRTVL